jgi:hypothetical protein
MLNALQTTTVLLLMPGYKGSTILPTFCLLRHASQPVAARAGLTARNLADMNEVTSLDVVKPGMISWIWLMP